VIKKRNRFNIVYILMFIILPIICLFFISPLLSKRLESIIYDPYIEKESRNLILESIRNNVTHDDTVEIITQNKKAFVGKDQFGRTIIHDFVLLKMSSDTFEKFLIIALDMGVDINARNYLWTGGAPIHEAVRINDKDKLEILIMNGADIHLKNNMGESPMAYALRLNHESIVKFLEINYEVDTNASTVILSDFRRFIYAIIFTGYQRPWAFKIFIILLVLHCGICVSFLVKRQFYFHKQSMSTAFLNSKKII